MSVNFREFASVFIVKADSTVAVTLRKLAVDVFNHIKFKESVSILWVKVGSYRRMQVDAECTPQSNTGFTSSTFP